MYTIRVLQLGSPTGLYGAERWILALIKHLDPEQVESIVAVIKDNPSLDAPLVHEAAKLGFRTHVIEAYGRVNISAVKRLREFIRANSIHILHTHGYKTDLIGLLATLGTRCKIITTPHGWSQQADFKLQCYELIDRICFSLMDAVVPLSEQLHRDLRHIPGINSTLRFIRNGVDLSEIESGNHVAPELLEWKKEGAFILGYIGQLIPRKGLDTLLRAVATLHGVNWRLAIVGDGESRQELEDLAVDLSCLKRIRFFGFKKDRLSFLRGLDVFVLPSRMEGIPRCLMEAMGSGIPVIASDIPGCRDLVNHGQSGCLFTCDDSHSLAEAIVTLGSSKPLRQDFATGGKQAVSARYSAYRMASEYQQLYRHYSEYLQ